MQEPWARTLWTQDCGPGGPAGVRRQQRKTLRGHGCLSVWGLVDSPTEHPGAVHSEHGPRGSREHGSPERNRPVNSVSLLGPSVFTTMQAVALHP